MFAARQVFSADHAENTRLNLRRGSHGAGPSSVARFEAPALLRRCTEHIFPETSGSGPPMIAAAQAEGNGSVIIISGALR
jgi:hypothetical protein